MIDKLEEIGLIILEKIHLKKLADWYRAHKEGMRYLIFGAISTVVNILTYAIFASLILKDLPVEELRVNISELVAFVVSIIFAYITNKIYVFETKTENWKDLIREITSIWFSINDIFMKVFSNIVVIILNFIFSKLIIFKKKKDD